MTYPVIDVTESYQIEQLGTKSKLWFYKDLDAMIKSEKHLCKIGRTGTGENWAEKFTSELAQFLEIPCVKYDLAKDPSGKNSVVCPSFVKEGGSLVCMRNPQVEHISCYGRDLSFAEVLEDPWFSEHLDYIGFVNECDE